MTCKKISLYSQIFPARGDLALNTSYCQSVTSNALISTRFLIKICPLVTSLASIYQKKEAKKETTFKNLFVVKAQSVFFSLVSDLI